MTYQPNLWLTRELHRRVVAAARQLAGYTILLWPTRRHIFLRGLKLPNFIPDFFKPCFGVLCEQRDPDKRPCMVIETRANGADAISDGLRNLYEQYGVLWVYIYQEENQFTLECTHGGTSLRVTEQMGNLCKLLATPLSWYERGLSFAQGSLVHSYSERVLREAVQVLSPIYRIECHHQVPLGWVLGYREGMSTDERSLLQSEIDAVITQSYEADPDCAVVLPIKLDIYNSHRTDANTMQRDAAIRQLCQKFEVPLLTIRPHGEDAFEFQCEIFGLGSNIAKYQEASSWANEIAPFLNRAIRWAGRDF